VRIPRSTHTVLLLLLSAVFLPSCGGSTDPSVRILTYNLRVNTASDGPNAWPRRKDLAAAVIRSHGADLVGCQEALKGQVLDLAGRLTGFAWFGVARDDGGEEGEFNPVFYRPARFELLRDSTFWLSADPSVPGRGWDAACIRIVTWGEFRDRKTGGRFFLFNTHFDHLGSTARRESALLLLSRVRRISGSGSAVVTGDFNSTPDSAAYRILTDADPAGAGSPLVDSEVAARRPHSGPAGTFNGFGTPDPESEGRPIDFIFVTRDWTVLRHATLDDTFGGRFPSDHWPVLAEIAVR
jgi:endonuclease/exonuclease/phosphatase family metal-dependent hydrolase